MDKFKIGSHNEDLKIQCVRPNSLVVSWNLDSLNFHLLW
jgi:hypothetical protein